MCDGLENDPPGSANALSPSTLFDTLGQAKVHKIDSPELSLRFMFQDATATC